MKPNNKIVTGITATGRLTLGNYLGALKNMISYQKDHTIYLFVADLHATSEASSQKFSPEVLRKTVEENTKLYLSLPFDHNKVKIFKQSDISEHLELFYLLLSNTNEGELSRMTQYKDKSAKASKADNGTEFIPVGLFTYPVLMAADILLYNPMGVIVGQDQKQHLELTQKLAERVNKKYKLDFTIPRPIIPKVGAKIMALRKPDSKMSKSDEDKMNTIFLLDSDEDIIKKITTSLTDSENKVRYDVDNKPGVSNLLTIYASIKDITVEQAEQHFINYNYKDFKNEIANVVVELIKPIREKYNSIDTKHLNDLLHKTANELKVEAKETVHKVMKGMGLK